MNERILELINLAIDGEATPSEKAELAEILGKSEEAMATFEAIQKVVGELASVPAPETPSFRDDVITAIQKKQEAFAAHDFRRPDFAEPKRTRSADVVAFDRRRSWS